MNRKRISRDTPIGQIAREYPAAIDVFEELDIEYVPKGATPLGEACEAAGVEATTVIATVIAATSGPPVEPSIGELVQVLLFEQHTRERAVMGEIEDLLRTNHQAAPEIARIRRIFENLSSLIRQHMQREERDLFPAVEALERALVDGEVPRSGSLATRLWSEYVEHEMIDELLHKLRELRLRAELHGAPRILIETLDGFERRVYRHMHLENNVLFPKALEIENQLKAAAHLAGSPR